MQAGCHSLSNGSTHIRAPSQISAMGDAADLLRLPKSGVLRVICICLVIFDATFAYLSHLIPQKDALVFEWAWQHPLKSKAVREMAKTLTKREMQGAKGKVRLPTTPCTLTSAGLRFQADWQLLCSS